MYAVADQPARLDDRTFSVPDGDLLALYVADREAREERRRSRERLQVANLRRCRVRVWPAAKEATITPWRGSPTKCEAEQLHLARAVRQAVARKRIAEDEDELRRLIGAQDAKHEERAVRRARTMIRRMCREFNLCRMWTLTYAGEGCHDRDQLVRDMEEWAREMKRRLPRLIWLAVPELHPGGHGWHVHAAVSEYVHFSAFNVTWPHGRTESPRGPDGKKLAGRVDANVTAAYLSKYVAKSLGEGRTHLGQHRYFRPKGVQVSVEDIDAGAGVILAYDEARRVVLAYFGGAPSYEWTSDDDDQWEAPPVAYMDFWPRRERSKRDGPRVA